MNLSLCQHMASHPQVILMISGSVRYSMLEKKPVNQTDLILNALSDGRTAFVTEN